MPIDPQLAARFATMSPHLFRDLLIGHARLVSGPEVALLDATREAPNWQQRDVQLAWHVLGLYCDYVYGVVGEQGNVRLLPTGTDIDHEASFSRFAEGLMDLRESLAIGADYLSELWPYLARKVLPGHSESEIIAVFTRAMSAAAYPYPATLDLVPPLLLHYLAPRLFGGDLMLTAEFAVHVTAGASDGLVQIARTLTRNQLLCPGDKVALCLPADPTVADLFARQFECEIVGLPTSAPLLPEALSSLEDPAVKLLLLPGPGTAQATRVTAEALDEVVARRPDLLLLADCSGANLQASPAPTALARWPRQTLGVYSFSRDFGLAGARLGVVLVHRDCVANDLLAALPAADREANERRYAGRLPRPSQASFLNRLVEEDGGVAFGHRAGLPTPIQVLLCLCACYEAVSGPLADAYFAWVREELGRRRAALYAGLGLPDPEGGEVAAALPTALVDLEQVARALAPELALGLQEQDPWSLFFHLAHSQGLIVLPGVCGGGELWSVRLSLLGLGEAQSRMLGQRLAEGVAEFAREGPCVHCAALLEGA